MVSTQNETSENVPTPLDLYSLSQLEALLGRSREELTDLAKHAVRYYKPFILKKKQRPFAQKIVPAKKRFIDNPVDPLKAIQSRIEERLLKRVILPQHLLGGRRGKTILDNANLHVTSRYLVTIDIKNFFPSITPYQIREVWRRTLNCSPAVGYMLTGLTTYRGRLPQGAPTSTLLANLVLSRLDPEIKSVCNANAVCYSSWVDDLAFSGDSVPNFVGPVISVLMNAGFSVSHSKIRVMGPGQKRILNKLVLDRVIMVQREYLSHIRAGIHNLLCGKVPSSGVDDYVESLAGRINYLRLFDARKAHKFHHQLNDIRTSVGAPVP
jgi:RNA-directed DNA polymerase